MKKHSISLPFCVNFVATGALIDFKSWIFRPVERKNVLHTAMFTCDVFLLTVDISFRFFLHCPNPNVAVEFSHASILVMEWEAEESRIIIKIEVLTYVSLDQI